MPPNRGLNIFRVYLRRDLKKSSKISICSLVRHLVEEETVAHNHHTGLALLVRRPVRKSLGVGIAGLGEINPIARHYFEHMGFNLVHFHRFELVAVYKGHFGHMGCAATGAAEYGVFRILVEVVHIYLSLAGAALKIAPCVGAPAEASVPEYVGQGIAGLLLVRGRILLEDTRGKIAVYRIYTRTIHLYRQRAAEKRTFVGVPSHDDVDIVVDALFIELVLVVGDGVAVDNG